MWAIQLNGMGLDSIRLLISRRGFWGICGAGHVEYIYRYIFFPLSKNDCDWEHSGMSPNDDSPLEKEAPDKRRRQKQRK